MVYPRFAFLAFALLLAPVAARAGLFGRDKLASRWTERPVPVNGDDTDWNDSAAFEEDGIGVLAMNDGADLYLVVTGHTREARDQLSGESRQDVAVWFVGDDGKTRAWGARLPFSRRGPLTNALRAPAGLDPEPEFVQYQGASISTAPLPDDVIDHLAMVGRRPVWELKVPLSRLAVDLKGSVAVDLVVNAPPGGAKRQARPAQQQAPTDGGADGGTGRGRKRGGAPGHPEDLVWDALSYSLRVRLAPDPASQRGRR